MVYGVPPWREKAVYMYHVYILQSLKNAPYYIGYSSDIEHRLEAHNSGKSRYTKRFIPWQIVYTETYATKREALIREKVIKSYKGGRAFQALIESGGVA